MTFLIVRLAFSIVFMSAGLILFFIVARLWWAVVSAFVDMLIVRLTMTAIAFGLSMFVVGIPITFIFAFGVSLLPDVHH